MASGRSGMGHRIYRRNRAELLAHDDLCTWCGHHEAKTADHIISAKHWPRQPNGRPAPGFDDIANLTPSHGTMGNRPPHNPCPTCGLLCNQVRGTRPLPMLTRRPW
jgi:hypothetical protein